MAQPFFAIGHGTRPLPELVDLLKQADVTLLADVGAARAMQFAQRQ